MTAIDSILRNGKELSQEELGITRELVNDGLCEITESKYLKCVYREDDDFNEVLTRDCPGEVQVTEGELMYTCPECSRTIYREDKEQFSRHQIRIIPSGILSYLSNFVDSSRVDQIKRLSDGRKWNGYDVDDSLQAEVEGDRVMIPLLYDLYTEDLVEWMCISPYRSVPVLIGESIPLDVRFEELNIPSYSFGELYELAEEDAISELTECILDVAHRDPHWNVSHRAELSYERSTDSAELSEMSSNDFEFIVQNLLQFTLGSSTLLGATEPGSGYPDGILSLHWNSDSALFMWDAKFVRDYRDGAETTLSGEYDKIHRHLTNLREHQQVRDLFGDVSGVVLISPGIKTSQVVRLSEFIREQKELVDWAGYIILFTLGAMNELYSRVSQNSGNYNNKPNSFMRGLHTLLTNKGRHTDDPGGMSSSAENCIEVNKLDIERLFEDFLHSQKVESHEFDREAYTEYMNWVN